MRIVGAAGENMKIDCQYVSASEAGGEIFQILMEAERDQDEGPHLLLQRAFLEKDEGDDAPPKSLGVRLLVITN